MKARQVTKNGKRVWMLNARSQKRGRFFGATKDEVWEKYDAKVKGVDGVEFTDEDRRAKVLIGSRATLMQAAQSWVARTPEKKRMSLESAGAEWLLHMEAQKISKGFVNRCRVVLNQLKRFVGDEGKNFLVSEFTSEQIVQFLGSFVAIGTQNTVRGRLSHFFTFCLHKDRGYCTSHPIRDGGVEKVRERRERKAPPRIFTVDECRRLLRTAQEKMPHMIPYLALGLFCGIRPDVDSEMGRMAPADIHLDAGMVDVPEGTTKGGDGRPVRLVQTIKQSVRDASGKLTEENITFAPARDWLRLAPSLEIVADRYWREKLCEAAGVEWSSDVMRHTFASYHFYFFKSGTDTSEQMGHNQSLTMLKRHYLQRVTDEAAAAFWNLRPEPIVKVLEAVA